MWDDVFPGSPQQHDGVTDVTDAALFAEQMLSSATTPTAANEPLQARPAADGSRAGWSRGGTPTATWAGRSTRSPT